MRTVLIRFTAVMISLVVATMFALTLDLAAGYRHLSRLFDRQVLRNVHVTDDLLGWKPRNSSVGIHQRPEATVEYTMDELGFKAVPQKTDSPRFTIYFFGDSFTFGDGVTNADTFANILSERYLSDRVNVRNGGVMGYGFPQIYGRFLSVLDRINPGDLVILTPLSDDIRRNFDDFLFVSQYLFARTEIDIRSYPAFSGGELRPRPLKTLRNKLKALLFNAPVTGRFWYRLYRRTIPDSKVAALAMIGTMKAATESRGGRFILIFLPNPAECESGRYANDLSRFDYEDIRASFPRTPGELAAIKFMDGHWNARGHEIAARAIFEVLRRRDLLLGELRESLK